MSAQAFLVRYHGFKPTHEEDSFLHAELSELFREAPPGSFFYAHFSPYYNGHKGALSIQGAGGRFAAKAVGNLVPDVIESLMRQIRQQYHLWEGRTEVERRTRHVKYLETMLGV